MFNSDPGTIYLFQRNSVLKRQEGPQRAYVFIFIWPPDVQHLVFSFFVSLYQEQNTFQQTIKVVKIINMSQPSVFISSFSSLTFDRCLEKEIFQSPDIFVKNKEAY